MLQEIRLRVQQQERALITTLTKKMAEQLTDYLERQWGQGALPARRQRWDTVERVESSRDLRLGALTCWWASTVA